MFLGTEYLNLKFLGSLISSNKINIRYLWYLLFNIHALKSFLFFQLNFFQSLKSFIPDKWRVLLFQFTPLEYTFKSFNEELFGINRNIYVWLVKCMLKTWFFLNLVLQKKSFPKIFDISQNVCALKILSKSVTKPQANVLLSLFKKV